ncbi:hypothetical protein ACG02S_22725 [Roseateles sp. DC23W]|uniref:Uncharacterized protein n=1 Tax=Pelomonas dachongensis TaxID=3299029 RepID=A0ABW7EX39_9BURK
MNATTRPARYASDESLPASDLPVFTRLLPALVSGLALAPAALAYEFPGRMDRLAVTVCWLQTLLLVIGAVSLATSAHERLHRWEGRIAPAAAHARARARLLLDLGWMGSIGLSGPLVLAAVLDLQSGGVRLLPGVVALLSCGLCAGLAMGLAWQGRAPRWLLPPALLVLAALALPHSMQALSHRTPLQSLLLLGLAGVTAFWLFSHRSLVRRGAPLPQWNPIPALRRLPSRVWRMVPMGEKKTRALPFTMFVFVPQFQMHAERVRWLDWGRAYDTVPAALGYGLWLSLLSGMACVWLIAPPLHWRQRLAPGGMSAQRWALRLVFGSMLFIAAWLSLGLCMARLTQPVHVGNWAAAMGDALLAVAVAAWLRGRRGNTWRGLGIVLALGVVAALAIAVTSWLGLTPQRGAVWLAIQLALTVPVARAAIRAWAQQDLNLMA